MKQFLLLLLLCVAAVAQQPAESVRVSKTDPNGQSCTTSVSPVLVYNGTFYRCNAGSYASFGGGGGSLSDGDYGDITVGSSGTTLTIDSGVITNAKVNASAAIAYSKLNLTGAILNADLAGSIAISKLAITGTPTGSKYLRDDGSWQAIAGGGDALTTNPLSQFASTTSAELAGVLSDETGNGVVIFSTAPTITSATLVTPNIAKISNLTSNGFVKTGSGDGTLSIDTATYLNAANNLSDLGNASTARTNLGLAIGTNVQAYDADLTTYAGITPSANVQTLLGAANYAAFKTSLSLNNVENTALSTWAGTTNVTTLGTIGTGTWQGTAIANAYLANSAITICGASTALGSSVTATTCLDSIGSTRGSILYRGASGWAILSPGTSGYVLTSNGAGADPTYQAASGGGSPGGSSGQIQYNNSGSFGGISGSSISGGVPTFSDNSNYINLILSGSNAVGTLIQFPSTTLWGYGGSSSSLPGYVAAYVGGDWRFGVGSGNASVRGMTFGVNVVPANSATAHNAQLHVVSGSASRVGLRVDTASTPSAAIADFTNNGTSRVKIENDSTITFSGVAFSALGSTNGQLVYCSDCAVTSGADNTCAGSGTGALAMRLNGVWRCFIAQN